jgi:RNA polymerase sigma-70 factor, ECF subfamily
MDDAAAVERVLAGDAEAFTAIVNRHYADCLRYAGAMLGSPQDAEDVVQETFVRAYRGLGRYREADRFRHWLFRILVNQCRTAAVRRSRRAHREVEDPGLLEAAAGSPCEGSWDEWEDFQRALARLNPEQRETLLLKLGEGLEYSEIARLTGASVSALKMRVARARDSLREFVRKDNGDRRKQGQGA